MGATALAINEVPNFLPEDLGCWVHGPCPDPLITAVMIEDYIRAVSPVLKTTHLPDAVIRSGAFEVQSFHRQCNTAIRNKFASNFSAGNFQPAFTDKHRLPTEAFFRTEAWARLKQMRRLLTPREAAAPYEPMVARLPQRLRAEAQGFLRSPAGQWWLASRESSWRRILSRGDNATHICGAERASFQRQLVGLLVEQRMTEPLRFRATRRPLGSTD
jgi:hypothetical protein